MFLIQLPLLLMSNLRPEDIIDIKSQIKDIHVDLAYASCENFTGKIIPGYESNIAFLTIEAVNQLAHVQDELRAQGLGLKILDSYRPVQAVKYFQNVWKNQAENLAIKKEYYPEHTKEELFDIGYIAKESTHSRGSTVDLTIIVLKTQEELDMGTKFDFFSTLSHTLNTQITKVQKQNRLILKNIMEKYNFKNYEKEWWHFRLLNEPYPDTYFDFKIQE